MPSSSEAIPIEFYAGVKRRPYNLLEYDLPVPQIGQRALGFVGFMEDRLPVR